VVPQIGVSRFRIDLGIVHPDRPGDYLVGVECDGAAYHSAATARDRDKVRQAILEGLGWELLRVWSTDWWIDRQRAADKLHCGIEALLDASRAKAEAASTSTIDLFEEELESHLPDTGLGEMMTRRVETKVPSMLRATLTSPAMNVAGHYRRSDFTALEAQIDPEAFYETRYDGTLIDLIGHVISNEAPIAEPVLVQTVARAHGFKKAGSVIRERVMALTQRHFHVEADRLDRRFVWPDADTPASWVHHRPPATEDDIRQIEEIALPELRAAALASAAPDVPVDVARQFGVRRLSVTARQRIVQAMEQ
jgi:hypothetical protein